MKPSQIVAFAAVALCVANVLATPQLPFKRGTNCRGLDESAYSTSTWGKTYIYGLDSTYTDIKAKGFDFVRFSVDLTKYYDSNNDCLYTSGSYNITNIDTFLQKFIDAGLSPHLLMGRFQGGSMDSANAAHQAKFKRVWQLVADRYKDWPDSLVFELINEPPESTDEAVAVLNTLFAETVAVIRQTNPTRLILWPVANSGAAGSIEKKGWVELPEDHSNIAIVVHSYASGAFTHQGASWCTDANGNPMNYHVDLTDAHRLETRWDFGSVRQYAEAHPDIPLVLNEFGVMSGLSTPSEAYEWLFAMREFCESGNISWAHFEYTDYNNYQGFATRSAPTGDTWRTNVLEALFPKGWDDQPLTYGQLDLDSFSKRMTVLFAGYAGAETLTDFPVLVKLSSDIPGFSYSDFQMADGGDLRFADSSGKHIPHEIDTWNPNGVSTVWVRVPLLTASTSIFACYGCANPPPVQGKDVWNDDYVGVWHLGGASLPLRESSRKSVSFTQRNGRGLTFASPGVVGGSVAFDGGMSNSLIAVDHDAFDKYSKYTFEVWTKQSEHKQNAGILCKSRDYDVWRAYLMTDSGSATRLSLSKYGNAITDATDLFDAPVDGSWRHQVCSLDTTSTSGNVKGYLNGELAGTQSVKTNKFYTGAGYLVLGNTQPIGRNTSFNGSIDEVRISKCIRSADWVKASHDTVADASFATYFFGDVPPPEPERILYINVDAGATNTLDSTLVTEYITNIVKQGAGTLVASAIQDYTHLITVESGVWRGGASAGDFGAAGTTIDVKDGASLYLTGSNPSNLVANALSGKTVNLYGAKASSANAKIVFYNKTAKNIGSNVSINLKDSDEMFVIASGGTHVNMTSGTIDLGGHELRLKANGTGVRYELGATFKNGGSLVYDKCLLFAETYVPTLAQAGASGATLRLENAALNLKKAMSPNGWNIVCSNSFMTGNAVRFPATTGVPNWDGGVQFLKSSSIANYTGGYNVSNTVFNLKGAASGSGTLKVGPGWLNLHNATNTYSGKVTVNGQNLTGSNPILAGGGGIGLWNGADCFPSASSVTFTNTARLAFMDNTKCSVGNATFVALAGETQSISGGVYTARSTIAGITKTGAGTLLVDSPAQITGVADIQSGTLKVANRVAMGSTVDEMVAPQPVFSSIAFASGTALDLSGNYGFKVADLTGSPSVTNAGVFGVSGKWTLTDPGDVLNVTGENVVFGANDISGMLAFASGSTFDLSDEAAFSNAVVAAGAEGLVVARASWMLGESSLLGMTLALPQPAASISQNWEMRIDSENQTLRLFLNSSASGYAAWVAGKGLTGDDAAFDKETNGIKNGIRYAFDIDPASSTVGDPIIKVVFDSDGNPVVQSRNLASGRDDVTFGILATENLTNWDSATLIPMKKFSADGYWKPTASEDSTYVYPAKMFFKYTIEVQ
jgi:endoglucanase